MSAIVQLVINQKKKRRSVDFRTFYNLPESFTHREGFPKFRLVMKSSQPSVHTFEKESNGYFLHQQTNKALCRAVIE